MSASVKTTANTLSAAMRRDGEKRARLLVTPEGLALPLTIGSRGARAAALVFDIVIIALTLFAFVLLLVTIGFNVMGQPDGSPATEFISIILVLTLFLSRYGYFLYFELGPRAATPGKRLMGLRVAARPVGANANARLTAERVIARNLIRDVEVFMPAFFFLQGGGIDGGVAGYATAIWLGIFVLFPFFNKDGLRAGDLVAGTWVVEAKQAKLQTAMSLAPDRSHTYKFGEAELSVYGEHELQVLEGVLRADNEVAMREVAEAICRKIGWEHGSGDEREFLESFYAALRGHLESGMRFGKRKKDKYS